MPESLKGLFYVDKESGKGARRDERREDRSVKIAELKGNLEAGKRTGGGACKQKNSKCKFFLFFF